MNRPDHTRLIVILGILTAFGPLSIDMYLPGLPTIARDFGTDTAAVQRTLSTFFIGLAVGQAFYGPIADRVGRKLPLLFGCILYTVASLICALAPTLDGLILARLGQALGGCAGMVIARSMVRDTFAERDAARAFSFLMLVMGIAPITAPILGGQLLQLIGWRAIFWVLAGFGLICTMLTIWALPETLPTERRVRAGLGQALQVYWGLLRDRHFVSYALAGGLISAGMFAYIAGSPFVLIDLYAVAPDRYGWIFGTNAFGFIVASQFNTWLLRRYSSAAILPRALSITAISGLCLVAAAISGFGGLFGLLIPLFFCVASGGLIGPNTSALAMAPHGRAAGSASALMGTLQFMVGTSASILVEVFHNGTALPMALTISACGLAALLCLMSTHWLPLPDPKQNPA